MNFKRLTAILAVSLTACVTVFAAYPKYASVTTPDGRTVKVVAIDENILKVVNTAKGETARIGGSSVLDEKYDGECLNPDGKGVSANICGLDLTLTAQGVLTINAGPGKKVIDSGMRPAPRAGVREISLEVDARGSFYGTGERGHRLNLRGDTLVMYNRQNYGYTGSDPRTRQMNITMPLFLASDGYAIVFDDYAPAEMILGNPIRYITESPDAVTWYFVNGAKTLADVSESLTHLTGRQNLPPLWTLGYITSKYGYRNQTEAEDAVDSLKHFGYPVDGLILDLYWYGKEEDMGRLEWDRQQWPDHVDMLEYLTGRGVHVIPISQPYVLRNGRGLINYEKLAPQGMFMADSTGQAPQDVKIWVGEGGMFDVSNPATRQWLKDRYYKLTQDGLSGWWGDLGEPEVHPENGIHANGLTGRQYHNKYGNDWSEILYEMYTGAYPDRRMISMMRGGTTGLQRYDVFPWSTDVSRSWGGLEPQVRIMLNSGLSGLGYMGHDVGGFAVDPAHPTDPELYVRWLQLGQFSPMLRTHATVDAEPYHYPEHQDIIQSVIRNRYRWLPYNYTLAWENATKGWPLVRPLNYHSEDATENYDNISDEFLWGRDVLVAPVMTPGTVSRDVTLPAGSEWVDINNPTKYYKGGTVIRDYPAPLEVIPMFAREGAFIPMADYKMQNTKGYNRSKLTVQYYPSKNVKTFYTMFEDDMTSPSAKTGNRGRTILFSGDATANGIDIEIQAEGNFAGQDEAKTMTLVVNNQTSEPKGVTLNGTNVRYTYDKKKATLSIAFIWKTAKPAVIRISK